MVRRQDFAEIHAEQGTAERAEEGQEAGEKRAHAVVPLWPRRRRTRRATPATIAAATSPSAGPAVFNKAKMLPSGSPPRSVATSSGFESAPGLPKERRTKLASAET